MSLNAWISPHVLLRAIRQVRGLVEGSSLLAACAASQGESAPVIELLRRHTGLARLVMFAAGKNVHRIGSYRE